MRADGRQRDELRRIEIESGFVTNPAGAALIRYGRTMVLCTASAVAGVPEFRVGKGGWLTAEYQMAPGSTHSRSPREAAKGGLKGRTHEIQRLIGRSLRPTIDLKLLGENTIHIDCEVLQADGGTRTASITGAWVALALACDKLIREGRLERSPLLRAVAAVSVGIVDGEVRVDLDYGEDSRADVDANIVLVDTGELVEVQATGEGGMLSRQELDRMLDSAQAASERLFAAQREAVGSAAMERLGFARTS